MSNVFIYERKKSRTGGTDRRGGAASLEAPRYAHQRMLRKVRLVASRELLKRETLPGSASP